MKIGIGYDAHRLVSGRPLILGGCVVPFESGLQGHSDADVLIHAIMDAILGAAGLGDIGRHFPPEDNRHKDACSLHMLGVVGEMIKARSLTVSNIDAVIVAERPKLADFLPEMSQNIAETLGILKTEVNIKATTEEGMGFTGKKEGMAAHAVVLLMGANFERIYRQHKSK